MAPDRTSEKRLPYRSSDAIGRGHLSSAAPRATELLQTSRGLGWKGIVVERHRNEPGSPGGEQVDQPVLIMLCSPTAEYEYREGNPHFVRATKTFGALTVFAQGSVPDIRLLTTSEFAYCALDKDFLNGIMEEMEGVRPHPLTFQTNRRDAQLRDVFRLLLTELDAGGTKEPLYIESLAHALAVKVLRLGNVPLDGKRSLRSLPCAARIKRLKEKIDAQLSQNLTLTSLAEECGYSRTYFLRWFRAQTGLRPHEYVLKQRLEKAAASLSRKDTSLTDIAAACGFSSQSHMTTAFRKQFGATPAAYRRDLTS